MYFCSACGSIKQRLPRRARLTRMQSLHYGTPQANSLHLIKHYFEQYPEDANKVVLSIKGAYHPKEGPNGSPEGIRASVEEAVKVLPPSIKPIDVFECARVDPKVPIEISIKALAEMVKEGKIRGVGLSEAGANTIRKAHAVHPVSAVEIELSLFTPDPLYNGIADVCHERTLSSWKRSREKKTHLLTLWSTQQLAFPSRHTAPSAAACWRAIYASSTTWRRMTSGTCCRASSPKISIRIWSSSRRWGRLPSARAWPRRRWPSAGCVARAPSPSPAPPRRRASSRTASLRRSPTKTWPRSRKSSKPCLFPASAMAASMRRC